MTYSQAEWLAECEARRARGGAFLVRGEGGGEHRLGEAGSLVRRHHAGLCPSCLNIGEHSACSGCLLVSYCSTACQKAAWPSHRQVCRAAAKLRGKGHKGGQGGHLLAGDPSTLGRVQAALGEALGRELSQYEADMLVHPR